MSKNLKLTDAQFQELYDRANQAGIDAVQKATVIPMEVVQHANPLDDSSPVVRSWHVPDGVCGFAWVIVKPGNSPFANWLKKNNLARPDTYNGGVNIWISAYNQSAQRKETHAHAMARVFSEAGIRCYAGSRLD